MVVLGCIMVVLVPDTVQCMMSLASLDQIQMEVRQLKHIHLVRINYCLNSADGCHRNELGGGSWASNLLV